MKHLDYAQKLLSEGIHTCVIYNGKELYTSSERGVKPLVLWYLNKMDFSDFSAADKVVGRATAFLYILLGVKHIYANVISRTALSILEKYDISAIYNILTDNIMNRSGDGICPFEECVLYTEDPHEAYRKIYLKMQELHISAV